MLQLPGDDPGLSIQAMLRAIAVALVALVACTDGPGPSDGGVEPRSCPELDDGCPPSSSECTWCRPVGETCLASGQLCSRGFGLCSEVGECRQLCREGQACPRGTAAAHEDGVCICAPD